MKPSRYQSAVRKLLLATALLLPAVALAHPAAETSRHHYDHKVAAAPGDYRPRLARAAFLVRERHFADAAEDLAAVERLAPTINTGYWRGLIALQQQNAAAAIRHLDHFIAEFPDHAEARTERGHAYLLQGDQRQALTELMGAVERQHPANPGLVLEAAELARAQGDSPLAINLAERALAGTGTSPPLHLFIIDTLEAEGRHAEALARLEQLLATAPDNPEWRLHQARLLRATAQPEEAEAVLAATETALLARKSTPWRNRTLAAVREMREEK